MAMYPTISSGELTYTQTGSLHHDILRAVYSPNPATHNTIQRYLVGFFPRLGIQRHENSNEMYSSASSVYGFGAGRMSIGGGTLAVKGLLRHNAADPIIPITGVVFQPPYSPNKLFFQVYQPFAEVDIHALLQSDSEGLLAPTHDSLEVTYHPEVVARRTWEEMKAGFGQEMATLPLYEVSFRRDSQE
jgi:hypothetical protein